MHLKITSYILILLMALMVFAPCADAYESEFAQSDQIVTVSSQQIHFDDSGLDEHAESCSPLCSCKCCPSVASDSLDITDLNTTSPVLRTGQIKPFIFTTPPGIIWSPPRLLF